MWGGDGEEEEEDDEGAADGGGGGGGGGGDQGDAAFYARYGRWVRGAPAASHPRGGRRWGPGLAPSLPAAGATPTECEIGGVGDMATLAWPLVLRTAPGAGEHAGVVGRVTHAGGRPRPQGTARGTGRRGVRPARGRASQLRGSRVRRETGARAAAGARLGAAGVHARAAPGAGTCSLA
jgi:hypothetical protein